MSDQDFHFFAEHIFFRNKEDVPQRLFVLAVTIAAIVPRMPFDDRFSIGGTLSNSFRKLLLITSTNYTLRLLLAEIVPKSLRHFMNAAENVMLSFLSLLTPYLLLVWLSSRVNVGRNPGKALEVWVYGFAGLNLVGAFLRVVTGDVKLWFFVKIADALSFIPVMNTIKLYNRVTNTRVRYPGRGSVLSQVVVIAEIFALVTHSIDLTSKVLGLAGILTQEQLATPTMRGLCSTCTYAVYTRILCHSVLLNVLDEAYLIGNTATTGTPASNKDEECDMKKSIWSSTTVETVEEEDDLLSINGLD